VADGPEIYDAATELARTGRTIIPLQADLSNKQGIDALHAKVTEIGRPVDALFANAGRGLGKAFLDQDPAEIQRVIDTNVSGTVYLLHRLVNDMRRQGWGRVLITGSIAGLMPGTYQAVYNASKSFVDSFAYALRHELADTGVSVTVLMPGPTDTDFFETADLLDTAVGASDKKDDPAMVAKVGYEAMLRGDGHEVSGFANKLQAAMTRVLNGDQLAKMHEGMAKPGTAKH
ncbi:MAG TPA: SDR family NAD(P)-dependent oxidoreductase, partial [Devosia sp.]|nr:SDR family NAD(P)-dependent oxidoreductase [Devosia sp.]